MLRTRMIFAALIAAAGVTNAGISPDLVCATDRNTNAKMCFTKKIFEASADERASILYRGGPAGVDNTSFGVHTYCNRDLIELSDRKGCLLYTSDAADE